MATTVNTPALLPKKIIRNILPKDSGLTYEQVKGCKKNELFQEEVKKLFLQESPVQYVIDKINNPNPDDYFFLSKNSWFGSDIPEGVQLLLKAAYTIEKRQGALGGLGPENYKSHYFNRVEFNQYLNQLNERKIANSLKEPYFSDMREVHYIYTGKAGAAWDSADVKFVISRNSYSTIFSFADKTKILTDALFKAVEQNDIKQFRLAIKAGASIETKTDNGAKILMLIAKSGNIELLKAAIAAGADFEAKDNKDNTVLMFAIESQNLDLIKVVLNLCKNINAKNKIGQSALMFAACRKNLDIFDELIRYNEDIQVRDINSNTLLSYAVQSGSLDMVKKVAQALNAVSTGEQGNLIYDAKGFDLNRVYQDNNTLLSLAIKTNSIPMIKLLIEAGADVNTPDGTGKTPLMHAVEKKYLDTIELFILSGANVKAQDSSGRTFEYYAERDKNVLGCIIKSCSSYNSIKNETQEITYEIVGKKRPELDGSELNLDLTLKINSFIIPKVPDVIADQNLITSIKENNKTKFMQALVDNADVNVVGAQLKRTPLHWAVAYSRVEALEILLNKGGDINALDETKTVLELAYYIHRIKNTKNSLKVIELLQEKLEEQKEKEPSN